MRRTPPLSQANSLLRVPQRRAPGLFAAAVTVVVTAAAGLGLSTPALAQTSEDLAAQVDAVVAKREQLGEKISVLDEEANLAKVQLASVKARAEVNQTDVASAERSMNEAEDEVQRYALKAFTGGMGAGNAAAHQDPTDAIRSRTLLATAQGNREQTVEQVRAARSDLSAKQELLDETTAAKAVAQRRIESSRSEMKVAEGELATTEAQVKGELADALEREERQWVAAERAEAERRQAEAEAQAKADAAAQQAETEAAATAEANAQAATQATDSQTSASSSGADGSSSTEATAAPQAASGAASASPKPTSASPAQAPRPTAPPAAAAPPPPPPPPPPASTSQGQRAVQAALSMRGTPYRWGGETPGGFDCSGLVLWAYAQAGRSGIPHSSRMQVSMGRRISVGELVPGDLVAYGSPVHHIGIYMGGGQYVYAPQTGDVVKTGSIYRTGGSPIAVRI